ncbi:MAG: C39 family peptidase [Anaerolineae bacterium]|nr:C39 family peptidase [Anaerolineae bacterium]
MSRTRGLAWLLTIATALLLLAGASPAWASPAYDQRADESGVIPRAAPARYFIGQLKHSVQTLNNCGPASVVSVLSYYGIDVSQEAARQVLRPYAESRGMGWQVIAPYVATFGLETKPRVNGNDDIIKALVANDIPVIVLQIVSESYRVGHFRVVQGYDDKAGVFYANDSLLGPNIAIPYASFDARWEQLGYSWNRYIPIYRPEQAPLVAAILGTDWSDVGMYTRALPDVRAAAADNPDDRQAWSRLVEALTGAERYQEALTTLDRSPNGRSGPGVGGPGGAANTSTTRIKLLNKVGRYQEALDAAETAIARGGSVGGRDNGFGGGANGALWLQQAEALRGLGRLGEARAAYQRAIDADPQGTEAADRLATLPGR